MRLLALAVAASAALLAAGIGQAASSPVLLNCGKPVVRPAAIVVTCADANYQLRSLKWSSWGGASATATGTAFINDCTPYCAAGHVHSYAVHVTLGRLIACGSSRHYNLLTVLFTGARPKGFKQSDSISHTCSY
jgi:hypothetical protein